MSDRPGFLFVTCQMGAEQALKQELAVRWPLVRLAYSRPGFLTFKLPADHRWRADFHLGCVFGRAHGFSLGKASGSDADELARGVWQLYEASGVGAPRRLHVWQSDTARPGEEAPASPVSGAAREAAERIRFHSPLGARLDADAADPQRPARPGELVLDCVLIPPGEWWVGYHQARSVASLWPGGVIHLDLPGDAVSRAWLKMEEALRWSRLPVAPGARWAEIGSAPGGSAQALLARGMTVLGIDPAEMHPAVLAHPRFTHLRKRASQVRRRVFRKIRWLAADMNVAPQYTLDAVEAIVAHPEVHIRGMLLTLKLFEWELAAQVPEYLERVRGWGYNIVRARQLFHNGQEVCVAALQKPFLRKPLRVGKNFD